MKNMHIHNPKKTQGIIEQIQSQWQDKLHVLSDFDRTLTKCYVDGVKVSSIISLLRSENILWDDYSTQAQELYEHYYPIEVDQSLSIAQRSEQMQQWWSKHIDIIIAAGLQVRDLKTIAQSKLLQLRDGSELLLNTLHTHNIPLVIVSANGLWWDSIDLYLKAQWYRSHTNIHIVSNTLIWDDSGYAIGRKEPLIHTFNKSETVVRYFPEIAEHIKPRKNVILLWDSIGDAAMIDWFEYDNLLKIWFLNKDEQDSMSEYEKYFDIILTGDHNMTPITNIIQWIHSQ